MSQIYQLGPDPEPYNPKTKVDDITGSFHTLPTVVMVSAAEKIDRSEQH
jgi:hypothetical protein